MKIGFLARHSDREKDTARNHAAPTPASPVKSVVQVHFPARNMTLAYYNDSFDLHRGDLVFVEGKLEGLRGQVVDVTYNFKIRLSDYKRVIALVDSHVNGQFHIAGSHAISFDRNTIPYEKILTWFKAPDTDKDEYVYGNDNSSFRLDTLSDMGLSETIADRGLNYYKENKVIYLSLDGARGRAIVEGSKHYELEFEYRSGEIFHLVCSCYCSYPCKHEFAAMLQLRETLELIEKNYKSQYEQAQYFAAISKSTLFNYVISSKESGTFTLDL